MTRHPIAQFARNRNPKSQENRRRAAVFLQNRLLHSPRFARRSTVPQFFTDDYFISYQQFLEELILKLNLPLRLRQGGLSRS
jgi:hypothetical protein